MNKITALMMLAISAPAMANEINITEELDLIEVSSKEPLDILYAEGNKMIDAEHVLIHEDMERESFIGVAYFHPKGFADNAGDYADGISLSFGGYTEDGFGIRGKFSRAEITESDINHDLTSYEIIADKALFNNSFAVVSLGAGAAGFNISGTADFTENGHAFTEEDFTTNALFAELSADFHIADKLSATVLGRRNFSHDDIAMIVEGQSKTVFEDSTLGLSIQYEFTESLELKLSHFKGSDLEENIEIGLDFKF